MIFFYSRKKNARSKDKTENGQLKRLKTEAK